MICKQMMCALISGGMAMAMPASAQTEADDDPLGFLTEPSETSQPSEFESTPVAEPDPAPQPVQAPLEEPVVDAQPVEITAPETDEAPAESAGTPPPAPRSGPMLDEITVKAQKRAENVQDVPLSVTALGAEQLKENNLSDLGSISEFTPNLVILSTPTFNYITMRGVGTGFNRGLEQSVAIIIDEVYYGRASYLSNGLLDLAAIEVLRGPQGTLFGKNSAAGALHLRTAEPTRDYEFSVDGTYGMFNYWRARGTASGPIPGTNDELMFRVAFQAERRDGFIENTTLDRNEQNLDQTTIRAKLLWEPSATFSVQLQGTYGQTKQDGFGVQIHRGTPRSIAAMQVFDPEFSDELDDKTALDFPSFVDRTYYEATAIVSWEFAGGVELKSITNYAGFDEQVKFDADFSPIPFLTLQNDEEYSQFSQEIRFTSPPGEFQYVAGLFFFSNKVDALYRVENFATADELIFITGALGPNSAQYNQAGVALATLWANKMRARQNNNGGMLPVQESATNPFVQEADSYAAFFQADWQMSDLWTLVVGNRVSYEKKKLVEGGQILKNEVTGVEGNFSLTNPGGSLLFPLIQTGSTDFDDARQRTEFNVSPKVVLRYEGFSMGMVYASAAAGYKGGGFNAQPLAPNEVEFEEETSITFEAGTKMDLFDGAGRFNVSAFYTFYNDFQSSAFNGVAFVPTNVGEARVMGIEFDGAQALTNWLMFNISGSFIRSRYVDFPNGPCPAEPGGTACPLAGKAFAHPIFTTTAGLAMDLPLGNLPIRLIGNFSGSFATGDYLTTDRDPIDRRDSYFLARAALGLRDLDDLWSVMVYGSNLTDLEQIIDGDDQPTFTGAHFSTRTDPREVKVEARVRF